MSKLCKFELASISSDCGRKRQMATSAARNSGQFELAISFAAGTAYYCPKHFLGKPRTQGVPLRRDGGTRAYAEHAATHSQSRSPTNGTSSQHLFVECIYASDWLPSHSPWRIGIQSVSKHSCEHLVQVECHSVLIPTVRRVIFASSECDSLVLARSDVDVATLSAWANRSPRV